MKKRGVRIVVGKPVSRRQRARLVHLATKEILFREGDAGHTVYVISSGAVRIMREGPSRSELAVLGPGAAFGEIALITGDPRNATVEAVCDTTLLAVDRRDFFESVAADQTMLETMLSLCRRRLVERALATHPLFVGIAAADRRMLETRASYRELEPGEVIVQQGDAAPGMFVLLAGRAAVSREIEGDPVPVATLSADDVCAEISFLTRGPAIASVEAETRCFALHIPVPECASLLSAPDKRSFVQAIARRRAQQVSALERLERR